MAPTINITQPQAGRQAGRQACSEQAIHSSTWSERVEVGEAVAVIYSDHLAGTDEASSAPV